jgi:hypothetical protein
VDISINCLGAAAFLALSYTVGGCGGSPAPVAAIDPTYSWCPKGFEIGAGDTCYLLPAQKLDAPVLLYVHSASPADQVLAENKEAAALVAKGFAVVLGRGRQEVCGFSREQKEALCWPLDAENLEDAKHLAEGWDKALWQVGALLDGASHARYVFGAREGGSLVAQMAATSMIPGATYGLLDARGPAWKFGKTQTGALAVFGDNQLAGALKQASWHYVACPETRTLDTAIETLRDLNPAQSGKGIALRDPKCAWSDAPKR